MKTNQAGIDLIKQFEGCKLEAYICPAGKLTIGYGHTLGVYPGMRITADIAEDLLRQDLDQFEKQLNDLHYTLNENQFSALISFIFNLGFGNFKKSALKIKIFNNSQDPSIYDEFLKWVKVGGRTMRGLVQRRIAEADLYFLKPKLKE